MYDSFLNNYKIRKPLSHSVRTINGFWEDSKGFYKPSIITTKHDVNKINEIIDLINNDNYDELYELLFKFMCRFKVVDENKKNTIICYLFHYCIKFSDVDFVKQLIDKFGQHNIFNGNGHIIYNIAEIIVNCNTEMLNILFSMECFKPNHNGTYLLSQCAIKHNNIDIINRLENLGHQLGCVSISTIIFSNNNVLIGHILTKNIDLQEIFDDCDYVDALSGKKLNIEILNSIVQMGINISKQVGNYMICGVYDDNIDLVMYCHHFGVKQKHIDLGLQTSCELNRLKILEYFIQVGADINIIEQKHLKKINYQTFMVLLNNNYTFTTEILNYVFKIIFVTETDINIIHNVFEHVGNFDDIFKCELEFVNNMPPLVDVIQRSHMTQNNHEHNFASSILELFTQQDKFEHLKMIATFASDKLMLEIDRLFVIAVANGKLNIAEYLLGLGANVDYKLSFQVACFFGHYDMLKYLLNFNYDLNPELFVMISYGSSEEEQHIGYANLIENNIIFRNDVYQFGDSYDKILKLLVENNVGIPDLIFFEYLKKELYTVEIVNYMVQMGIEVKYMLKFCDGYVNSDVIDFLMELETNK